MPNGRGSITASPASGGYAIQLCLAPAASSPATGCSPTPTRWRRSRRDPHVGGVPALVDIDSNYHIDMADLEAKATQTGAWFLLPSHMRGHIADMDRLTEIYSGWRSA